MSYRACVGVRSVPGDCNVSDWQEVGQHTALQFMLPPRALDALDDGVALCVRVIATNMMGLESGVADGPSVTVVKSFPAALATPSSTCAACAPLPATFASAQQQQQQQQAQHTAGQQTMGVSGMGQQPATQGADFDAPLYMLPETNVAEVCLAFSRCGRMQNVERCREAVWS